MSDRRMKLIALVSTFAVLAVIAAALYFIGGARNTAVVKLAEGVASADRGGGSFSASHASESYAEVGIDRENVRRVIATLTREENYYRRLSIYNSWGEDGFSYAVEVWMQGSRCRCTVESGDDTQKNILIDGETLYIWYGDSGEVYEGAVNDSSRLADEYQMIPTYEDIIALDDDDILCAEYSDYQGEQCIYVEARSGELDFTYKYWVSLVSGLLISAQGWDGEGLVYAMTTQEYLSSTPEAEVFELP